MQDGIHENIQRDNLNRLEDNKISDNDSVVSYELVLSDDSDYICPAEVNKGDGNFRDFSCYKEGNELDASMEYIGGGTPDLVEPAFTKKIDDEFMTFSTFKQDDNSKQKTKMEEEKFSMYDNDFNSSEDDDSDII